MGPSSCVVALVGLAAGIGCAVTSASAASFVDYVDPSGLRVVLAERPGSGLVASSVYVRAGAIRESAEMNGAAHFLEHLLFNGTETRTQEALYAEVDRLGAYNNATTQQDFALYMLLLGSEDARAGFDLHADMLFNSTLPPDKFEKEKGIVIAEIADTVGSDDWRVSEAADALFWEGAPLSRAGLGTEASIAGLSRDAVLAYYEEHYVASNMTLLVMGDFDAEEMRSIVADTYGRHARSGVDAGAGSGALDGSMTLPPGAGRARPLDVAAPRVYIRFDAPTPSESDAWPVRLLVDYWRTPLDRLTSDETLAVTSIGCDYAAVGDAASVLIAIQLVGGASVDDAGRATTAAISEIQRTLSHGVPTAAVDAVKIGRRVEESSVSDKIHYYALMRGDALLRNEPSALARRSDDIAAVEMADIERAARTWFAEARPRVVGLGAGFPSLDVEYPAVSHANFTPRESIAPPPTASRANAEPVDRVREARPPAWLRFDNGLTAIVESDPLSEVLAVHVAVRGRSAVEPEGKEGIAECLHRAMFHGTAEWPKDELRRRVQEIGGTLTVHDNAAIPFDDYYTMDPTFTFVRLETIDPFVGDACEIVGSMVRAPHLNDAVTGAVTSDVARLVAEGASARNVARAASDSLVYDRAFPMSVYGTSASIASITTADLAAFAESYLRPDNVLVTVVTSVEPATVADALARGFGATSYEWETPDLAPIPTRRLRATDAPAVVRRSNQSGQAYVNLALSFAIDPTERAPVQMATRVLSERLSFHIRERLGLAYRAGASVRFDDDQAAIFAGVGTTPENVDRVADEIAAQIDSVAVAAWDGEDLHRLAARSAGRQKMRRITRMGRAYRLAVDALDDNALSDPDARLAAERDVDVDAVRRVADRYLESTRAHRVLVR